ncbi:GNAT family N-acetyltransferase [Nitrosococcus wardiae]|uniref:N-acetyltransferase n=1 Tax=Nitrosococcus wardiae TaxID=1814290 RepID=A0A4P7C271_9GAMM|nr:GNAT family N-acetyltransferase [Nitrosococcus wardiae]QBQ55604.1 N-acetyltransferase [Nitrosococcus wardiae]
MRFKVAESIEILASEQWNVLEGTDNPFLCYEFLSALERHGCIGTHVGWLPRYLLAEDEQGSLLGAVPLYLKYNSFGEFVFDWSWAEAWERAGGHYYPKLVVAVPFSPVTGSRLLLKPGVDKMLVHGLIQTAMTLAKEWGVSSLHWLFPHQREIEWLAGCGLLLRQGYQFHWCNRDYQDFDGFLAALSSKRRKEVRRERRQAQTQGVEIKVIHGNEATDLEWHAMYQFYRATFNAKGNYPALTLPFFKSLGRTMGQAVVLALATRGDKPIAGALYLRSQDTLYGRYWGCHEYLASMHFELCYYCGLEYCIKHRLQWFEPGAQGEHKISRGFLPTVTWSAHWLSDSSFHGAVADFLVQERRMIRNAIVELGEHSPYRQ